MGLLGDIVNLGKDLIGGKSKKKALETSLKSAEASNEALKKQLEWSVNLGLGSKTDSEKSKLEGMMPILFGVLGFLAVVVMVFAFKKK